MKIIIDESVSYSLVKNLRNSGHTVIAIAEPSTSGLFDNEVFKIVLKEDAIWFCRKFWIVFFRGFIVASVTSKKQWFWSAGA